MGRVVRLLEPTGHMLEWQAEKRYMLRLRRL